MRLALSAYWKSREETAASCADRLSRYLEELFAHGSTLTKWYRKARSKRAAGKQPLDLSDPNQILKLVEEGMHRKDIGKEQLPELGFHIGLWNGSEGQSSASLSVTCGGCAESDELSNSVLLDLPEQLGCLSQSERMQNLLRRTVETWLPDWASVHPIVHVEVNADAPFPGWMVYLSRALCPSSVWPDVEMIEAVGSLGVILVLSSRPPAADDGNYALRADNLLAWLKRY